MKRVYTDPDVSVSRYTTGSHFTGRHCTGKGSWPRGGRDRSRRAGGHRDGHGGHSEPDRLHEVFFDQGFDPRFTSPRIGLDLVLPIGEIGQTVKFVLGERPPGALGKRPPTAADEQMTEQPNQQDNRRRAANIFNIRKPPVNGRLVRHDMLPTGIETANDQRISMATSDRKIKAGRHPGPSLPFSRGSNLNGRRYSNHTPTGNGARPGTRNHS